MTTLDQKIENLKKDHSFKEYISETINGYDYLAFITDGDGYNKRLIVKCPTLADAKNIIKKFPSTNETHTVGNENKLIKSPFRINIDNPAKPSQHRNFTIEISYISNDIGVELKIPIDIFIKFVTVGERQIYDSEHHYFIGLSYPQLSRTRVRKYNFNVLNDEQINWYGGGVTLIKESKIKEIIDYILD